MLRRDKGVITLRGLRELGFSEREVEGLVRHGDLRRLYRGVYADGRNQLTDRAHLGAALLAMGDGAWLAGRTAAAVWGLDAISLARIEIGVAATSTPTHTGLRVTREQRSAASLRAEDQTGPTNQCCTADALRGRAHSNSRRDRRRG